MAADADDVQEIVRLGKTDVDGTKRIRDAIREVKGIGYAMANAVTHHMEMDTTRRIGALDEDELERIEDLVSEPEQLDIPTWIRNRRKDRETGEDKHLIEADLMLKQEFDIRRLKEINSYKGRRHRMGLPVRGQKTQSSFRSGEKIGVQRERIQEEAEPEGDEE